MTILSCILSLGAWLVISQIVAFMITHDKNNVQTVWVGVFLFPVLFPMILLAFFHQWLDRQAQRSGLPVNPKDNPMDYLP